MPVVQCSGVGAVAYVGGAGAGLYIAMVYLVFGAGHASGHVVRCGDCAVCELFSCCGVIGAVYVIGVGAVS